MNHNATNHISDTLTDGSARMPDRAALSPPARGPGRDFPATDMPTGLMLGLVALGLPRTVLADLDIVAPQSGLLYYVLALTPFAAWLAVALVRRTRRPGRDFLMLGFLYGLSLLVVHQVLWTTGTTSGHPPQSVADFADSLPAGWQEFILRSFSSGIAVTIGVGTGLVAAAIAWCAHAWRSRRGHHDG
ncbi:hypothetical protein GCM10009678_13010 [Actinomadura kijaniata]|uniref:Uncharacterized protein n=1 Tax=Actinomadura namibiensis TaxID=182080 RepID=A0A7W3LNM5_ACTNM|nr:hypothetical protein [Actinomadura namibiensis]MBA8951427.1 hypothetical protein [Actinomadura namibiensis]